IDCLKELADAINDSNQFQWEPVYTQLKTKAWCLGFQTIVHKNGVSEMFKIVKPSEIYLDDNPVYSKICQPLLPPLDPTLPKLYKRFGAQWLSNCIVEKKKWTGKPVTSERATELKNKIEDRLPMLFVDNRILLMSQKHGRKRPYTRKYDGLHVVVLRSIFSSDPDRKNHVHPINDDDTNTKCNTGDNITKPNKPLQTIDDDFKVINESNEISSIQGAAGDYTSNQLIEFYFSFRIFSSDPDRKNHVHPINDDDTNTKCNTGDNITKPNKPLQTIDDDFKVINESNEISSIQGAAGDYTAYNKSVKELPNMPDFREIEKANETVLHQIYKDQSYKHSQFTQLEHTKTSTITTCEKVPAQNMTRFNRVFYSVPLYIESDVIVTDTMIDQAKQFAYLLNGLATHVFKTNIKTIHMFRDINGDKVAFNLGGAIFFNLHYFEQVYADKLKPILRTSSSSNTLIRTTLNFYFIVFCHELSHNIVDQHDEMFITCLQKIAVQFMNDKDLFLEHFSFKDYSKT
ncbi:unnamed protein product, partial [Didymodactylos carnosus]